MQFDCTLLSTVILLQSDEDIVQVINKEAGNYVVIWYCGNEEIVRMINEVNVGTCSIDETIRTAQYSKLFSKAGTSSVQFLLR